MYLPSIYTDFGFVPDLTYPACSYNWIALNCVSLTSKLMTLNPSSLAFNSGFWKTALASPHALAQDAKKKVLNKVETKIEPEPQPVVETKVQEKIEPVKKNKTNPSFNQIYGR